MWQPGSGSQDLAARIWKPRCGSQDLEARIWKPGFGSQDLKPRSGRESHDKALVFIRKVRFCKKIIISHWFCKHRAGKCGCGSNARGRVTFPLQ